MSEVTAGGFWTAGLAPTIRIQHIESVNWLVLSNSLRISLERNCRPYLNPSIYYGLNRTQKPEDASDFTSRYLDTPSSPLYLFGYGLSYTTFTIAKLRLGRSEIRLGESVEVQVVENTGRRYGDEVVLLYIHQRAGSASRPVRELKGIKRVTLAPGEKRTVRFKLSPDELQFWSTAERRWVQEAADFDVWVGADSRASLHATLKVIE